MSTTCQKLEASIYRGEIRNKISLKITKPILFPLELALLFFPVYLIAETEGKKSKSFQNAIACVFINLRE